MLLSWLRSCCSWTALPFGLTCAETGEIAGTALISRTPNAMVRISANSLAMPHLPENCRLFLADGAGGAASGAGFDIRYPPGRELMKTNVKSEAPLRLMFAGGPFESDHRRRSRRNRFAVGRLPAPGARTVAAPGDALLVDLR